MKVLGLAALVAVVIAAPTEPDLFKRDPVCGDNRLGLCCGTDLLGAACLDILTPRT